MNKGDGSLLLFLPPFPLLPYPVLLVPFPFRSPPFYGEQSGICLWPVSVHSIQFDFILFRITIIVNKYIVVFSDDSGCILNGPVLGHGDRELCIIKTIKMTVQTIKNQTMKERDNKKYNNYVWHGSIC